MDRLQYIRPNLIEPGVKYFLNSTLEQCNTIKYKYYNVLYNLGLLGGFIIIVSIILYYKYNLKHNRKIQEEKKKVENEYILSKLQFMQDYRKNQVNNMHTDLPNCRIIQKFNSTIEKYSLSVYEFCS